MEISIPGDHMMLSYIFTAKLIIMICFGCKNLLLKLFAKPLLHSTQPMSYFSPYQLATKQSTCIDTHQYYKYKKKLETFSWSRDQ